MSYITEQDMSDELGQRLMVELTDDEGTGNIDETRVLKAIEYAQGLFDSYARSRYSLPVPVTPMVKALNMDLAIFHLYKRMPLAEGVYQVRKNAHDEAMRTLRDISTGKAALDIPATEETDLSPVSSDKILTNAARAKYTDDALSSF